MSPLRGNYENNRGELMPTSMDRHDGDGKSPQERRLEETVYVVIEQFNTALDNDIDGALMIPDRNTCPVRMNCLLADISDADAKVHKIFRHFDFILASTPGSDSIYKLTISPRHENARSFLNWFSRSSSCPSHTRQPSGCSISEERGRSIPRSLQDVCRLLALWRLLKR